MSDYDGAQHACERTALAQNQRRTAAPGIKVGVRQPGEHALLDGLIAGVVLDRARLIDNPIPRDAAILTNVGQRIVQVLIGPPCARALLAYLPPVHEFV